MAKHGHVSRSVQVQIRFKSCRSVYFICGAALAYLVIFTTYWHYTFIDLTARRTGNIFLFGRYDDMPRHRAGSNFSSGEYQQISRSKSEAKNNERPPLPELDPFAPGFTKYLAFHGNPGVKCNGNHTRVEPWLRVVEGHHIVFSLPKTLHGKKYDLMVECSVKELKTWPGDPGAGNGEPSFWQAQTMVLWASKNAAGPSSIIEKSNISHEMTSLHLEESDFAVADCKASSVKKKTNRTMSWRGILTGIHRSAKFDKDRQELLAASRVGHQKPLNVFIFIIDTVSRYAAENVLPLTMEYLRSQLGAAVFEHHTVVGLNSLPNACGFLAGSRLSDLRTPKIGRLVDSPFIWKEFSKRGYVTAYMEDWTLTFRDNVTNYAKVQQPTDHIGIMFASYIAKLKRGRCLQNQPMHEYYLNLPEAMWSTYPEHQPKFYVGWFNQYSHQDATEVAHLDSPLMELLQSMHLKGHLDDTLTIIMGDHGGRFQEGFRNTEEGRHDHRTPLLAIVPPLMWKNPYPKGSTKPTSANNVPLRQLQQNTKELTSQFDIHATLWEVLNKSVPDGSDPLPDHGALFYAGQSLFTKLSSTRTCKEAGIPTIYCPYINWTISELPPSLNATYLGQKFVTFVNAYQQDYFLQLGHDKMPCKERVLQKIKKGGILTAGRFFLEVVVDEKSARAEFEVSGTYVEEEVNFTMQDVDRVDRFGNPPPCLKTFPESDEKKIMEMLCVCH